MSESPTATDGPRSAWLAAYVQEQVALARIAHLAAWQGAHPGHRGPPAPLSAPAVGRVRELAYVAGEAALMRRMVQTTYGAGAR